MTKKYQIIYADPPWRYSFSKSNSRKIENQYPTMTQKELCALSVPADDNSALYLWTTAPKLLEGLEVMKAWGFTYKSQAVWDKKRIGMGYWFRGQHEILLVGTKGKFSPPEQKDRRSSVFEFTRGQHSKKPDEVRDLVKAWFPDANRVELFCRYPAEGWDVWGNEVECTAELHCAV
jgi:N6-adenosine-specific RNA methylase IME4